jgi:phage shock protein C
MNDTRKVLRRSRTEKMIGGVMGGLAEYFGLDVSLLRIVYVVGSILSVAFPGLLVYVIMWIVIPKEER